MSRVKLSQSKPGLVPGFFLLALLVSCEAPAPKNDSTGGRPARMSVAGSIENADISEASGLAASTRDDDVYWVHNDSGAKAHVYAIDGTGKSLARLKLRKSDNRDWEDMAAFELNGKHYLLIADIGDNDSKHKKSRLYVVEEPMLGDEREFEAKPAWTIEFRYPDGPRDAEAVAVDLANERVLVLSKRDLPPRLYEIPLRTDGGTVEARFLTEVATLPQPLQKDVEFATQTKSWYWQPTGMDISRDGSAFVIMTYESLYYYERSVDWESSLRGRPLGFGLKRLRDAEAVAFGSDGRSIFVTTEQKHAPLVRVDFLDTNEHQTITLMTFNLQNLFDNTDDPGKDDKAYIPIAQKQTDAHIAECNEIQVAGWRDECLHLDWSDAAVDFKLQTLGETMRQVGGGPDIIAVQEVENAGILNRLIDEHLGDLGYRPAVLVEGQDLRGIDVAFISKLPLIGEPVLHRTRFPDFPDREDDTRGILEATFELPDGTPITGFAVHFPAPFHPTGMRETAYAHLANLKAALPATHVVFAAGDFNTTSTEVADTGILERLAAPYWTIAHETGCAGCQGTYYYGRDDTWSFLDMILFAPARSGNATWRIRANSVRVANEYPMQNTENNTPAKHVPAERRGVSDHWPLVVEVELSEKQ